MNFDWRREDDETIEHHFNPRLTVSNAMELLTELPERAARARPGLNGTYDVRYGPAPKETFDIFAATDDTGGSTPPAQIFIHGGYWRMMDKSDHSHLASDVTAGGVTHISLNYDLCPEVTLDTIVEQIRRAVIYIYSNAGALGIDGDRLYISGHSAGGHLTAMMMRQDWPAAGLPKDIFKGALPISGIFEPEAIMHTSINDDVRLDLEMAQRNGLLDEPPTVPAPVLAIVGDDEPEGFHEQSAAYVAHCRSAGLKAGMVSIAGANHFTVLDRIFQKDGELFGPMMAEMV
ncbi:MAG: alpha/beta hydrolase [Rhodospirillales bacterium]|jgi:arylformamidase|nr:esterase [Rhodospirillaceae bacterium]MDP6428191.1 alpha/beta hydrolase [Rhodospirillales bacterium]MDP6642926.1 alpha/beta hydrolase [Rhodospirillales bacterium]MDP6843551.1 alpha/beta hydrolase [Rhodospirillales bacterium]|tara:strand:+ start:1780 stop:2646 length:867 start_codon:yes stop_codon:yes gene_type:complete